MSPLPLPRPAPVDSPSSVVWAWLLVLLTVLTDLGVKSIAKMALADGHLYEWVPGVAWVQLHFNTGAAYGVFSDAPPAVRLTLFCLVSTAVMGWLALRELPRRSQRVRTGAALMLGGGLGNFVERVSPTQAVTDFIMLGRGEPWPAFGVFNLADVFILLGAGIWLVGHFRATKHRAVAAHPSSEGVPGPQSTPETVGEGDQYRRERARTALDAFARDSTRLVGVSAATARLISDARWEAAKLGLDVEQTRSHVSEAVRKSQAIA